MAFRPPLTTAFLAVACLLPAGDAAATQYTWYGSDGNGPWDTTSLYWSSSGTTLTAWTNGASNGAVFNNGPGIITVESAIVAGNLTFVDTPFDFYPAAAGTLTLSGSAAISVAQGCQATMYLPLAGSAGMTLTGGGELVLGSSNAYTGATTVSGGYLQLAASNALPSGNLDLDGGVIELAAGNFTRGAGTAASQVQFTANGGGFAAVGSNYFVNLGSLLSTMTWGSTYFLPGSGTLVLGSHQADATIDFQNPINLGAVNRTVQVDAGSGTAAIDAKLSGMLSGSGGLLVTGDGALALTASNSYGGGTIVGDSVLLSASNASALGSGGVTLAGGTLQLAVPPGGHNAVLLAADSGIDVTGATSGTLGNLLIGGNTLYVTGGGTAANSSYNLTLGNGTLSGRSIFSVADNGTGLATLTLGSLSGGSAAALIKQGSGTLVLSGTNSYVGGTTVASGTLYLASGDALYHGTRLTVGANGKTIFDPTATDATFAAAWAGSGAQGTATTVASVPEPSTLGLLLAAGIFVAVIGRSKGRRDWGRHNFPV